MGGGTGSPEKRIISPGFTEPSKLERDIIYVTFPQRGEKIDAVIESNLPFSFHSEKHTRYVYPKFNPDHYDLLIEELVTLNYGKEDYSRIKEELFHPVIKDFLKYLKLEK